jgi:two-component system, response regulator YesN
MLHVVIIEDEHWITRFIEGLVPWKSLGIGISGTAEDGESGLELCKRLRPDIVVTDIRMPNVDGLAMLANIRKTLPEAEAIIISGYDDFEYARTALRYGVADYLLKPINGKELIRALTKARRRIESRRGMRRLLSRSERRVQRLENAVVGSEYSATPLSSSATDSRILAALGFIEKRYRENISELDVAEHVGMSVSHFSELFKAQTGMNFIAYLRGLRMGKAQELLEGTLLRVAEVAEMVGYQNPNYFSRLFKEFTGRRASEFRSEMASP